MTDDAHVLTADRGDDRRRIDLVVRRHLSGTPAASRTRIQTWIDQGRIAINGVTVRRAAMRVALGDEVVICSPPDRRRSRRIDAEPIEIVVLYEDEHLLIVDKPAGIVVHPGYRNDDGTLLNRLLWRARSWGPGERPSIVGRLDKLTSGIVVVAKTQAVHAALQRAMAERTTEKEYLAVVFGHVPIKARGTIAAALARDPYDRRRVIVTSAGGRPSLTRYERIAGMPVPAAGVSLVRCQLVTGRMHQIRVHLKWCGWPIVGDAIYGEPRWRAVIDGQLAHALQSFPRQALHAVRLALVHPMTRERLIVESPMPCDLHMLLQTCGF